MPVLHLGLGLSWHLGLFLECGGSLPLLRMNATLPLPYSVFCLLFSSPPDCRSASFSSPCCRLFLPPLQLRHKVPSYSSRGLLSRARKVERIKKGHLDEETTSTPNLRHRSEHCGASSRLSRAKGAGLRLRPQTQMVQFPQVAQEESPTRESRLAPKVPQVRGLVASRPRSSRCRRKVTPHALSGTHQSGVPSHSSFRFVS